jgi:hypothetical protein
MAEDDKGPRKSPRTFSTRAERALKDADRLLRAQPDDSPERAMAQVEHAKVLALLNLAEAVREGRSA